MAVTVVRTRWVIQNRKKKEHSGLRSGFGTCRNCPAFCNRRQPQPESKAQNTNARLIRFDLPCSGPCSSCGVYHCKPLVCRAGGRIFETTADARQGVLESYFDVTFTLKNADGNNFTPPSFQDFIVVSKITSRSMQTSIVNLPG